MRGKGMGQKQGEDKMKSLVRLFRELHLKHTHSIHILLRLLHNEPPLRIRTTSKTQRQRQRHPPKSTVIMVSLRSHVQSRAAGHLLQEMGAGLT